MQGFAGRGVADDNALNPAFPTLRDNLAVGKSIPLSAL